MQYKDLRCRRGTRRDGIRDEPGLYGLDYLEVSTDPGPQYRRALHVYFIPKGSDEADGQSALIERIVAAPHKVSVRGGERIKGIRVVEVLKGPIDGTAGDLVVHVDRPGDHSTYTLEIDGTNLDELDPVYSTIEFNFLIGCDNRFDCIPREQSRARHREGPVIDYMAKDYASFRRAILDLGPNLVPGWDGLHDASLSVTIAEVLSYVGDHLSYYQDVVSNEAFLETARQRVSVRRHARLIDYEMGDGVSARTFVHFELEEPNQGRIGEGTKVLTSARGGLEVQIGSDGPVVSGDTIDGRVESAEVVFETLHPLDVHHRLSEMRIHPWTNEECCLPPGTTTLDLVGDLSDLLHPGDFLLLEEVKGPVQEGNTGLAGSLDGKRPDVERPNPRHRQIVRLTQVEGSIRDPLEDKTVTRISWDPADALVFPLCVSTKEKENVSVVRGNLALADHGRTIVAERHEGRPPPLHQDPELTHRLRLRRGPLSYRVPFSPSIDLDTTVRDLMGASPGRTLPQVSVMIEEHDWRPVCPDLLDCTPFDTRFVVESENDLLPVVRFGDGIFGRAPPIGADLLVTYRTGVGTVGNVGAEMLKYVVREDGVTDWPSKIETVRNPLPAWGGTDPESLETVKQTAPAAFHHGLKRSVTEEDYAEVAQQLRDVQRAAATFRWTGSWFTVFLTVDPVGGTGMTPELRQRVHDWVERHELAGYDLELRQPIYVPLHIVIEVCVSPDHFKGDVEKALLVALGNGISEDGGPAFFHPDNHTLGEPLYLSRLYAVVRTVKGVDSAIVKRFCRQHEADRDYEQMTLTNIDAGYLPIDRLEVARLDNDRNFPENGILELRMRGGK